MARDPQNEKSQSIARTEEFGKGVNFGRTSKDYRNFRAGFPDRFFNDLAKKGVSPAQGRALDLGTGTGTVARGLAQCGMNVVGIDPAEALLTEATQLDREAGVAVDYRVGKAEALPFLDSAFDLVVAGQCWHWFDRIAAAQESFRVLVPDGHMVIAHFRWLPLTGNVVEATERLILAHNPKWTLGGGSGIYPAWLGDLSEAGFENLTTFSFDLFVPYTHEGWRGRVRASSGVRASLDEEGTAAFDNDLKVVLESDFPNDPLDVPHRVWTVLGQKSG